MRKINVLEEAWDSNNPTLLNFVLENCKDYVVNEEFSDGKTPLLRAVDDSNSEAVRILCRLGSDMEEGRSIDIAFHPTLLHTAASNRSLSVTRALLENGANPNATDANNITPLRILQDAGFTSAADTLIREYIPPSK